MNNQSKQAGTALIMVLLVIGIMSATAIRVGYTMQAEKIIRTQSITATKAKQILDGVNEYYIAECYAGGGVYTQPLGVQEIIDDGYLSRGNYKNTIGGDFTVSIQKEGAVAIMVVEAVFSDTSDALAIAAIGKPGISVEYFATGNKVRWEMTNQMNSGLADLLKQQARRLQGGTLTC